MANAHGNWSLICCHDILFFYIPTILSLTKINKHIKQNDKFLCSRETIKHKAATYGNVRVRGSDDFILKKEEGSVLRNLARFPGLQGLILFSSGY